MISPFTSCICLFKSERKKLFFVSAQSCRRAMVLRVCGLSLSRWSSASKASSGGSGLLIQRKDDSSSVFLIGWWGALKEQYGQSSSQD